MSEMPFEDFDDRVLPANLFQASLVLCTSTVVLQFYQVICTIIIYQMAKKNRRFWEKVINLHKVEERSKTNLEPKPLVDLKSLERNLKLMNWLEFWLEKVLQKIKAFTTESSSFPPNDATNTLKTELATSFNLEKDEFERRVVKYVETPKEHRCKMCSMSKNRESENWKDTWYKMLWQLLELVSTLLCLAALLMNYNQIIFYVFSVLYMLYMLLYIITKESIFNIVKLTHALNVIFNTEVCGHQKVTIVNESVVMLFALSLFFCFGLILVFYCFRDEFFIQIITQMSSL